jgi:CheY-like chemotaxis protein
MILVVEDEKIMLETLRDYLESEGFSVRIASNGKQALEVINEEEMPSLILLDMKMPVMDGWEFIKVLRQTYTNPAPVIVMTAAVDAQQRANDIQALDYIEKPLSLDELLFKIKKRL